MQNFVKKFFKNQFFFQGPNEDLSCLDKNDDEPYIYVILIMGGFSGFLVYIFYVTKREAMSLKNKFQKMNDRKTSNLSNPTRRQTYQSDIEPYYVTLPPDYQEPTPDDIIEEFSDDAYMIDDDPNEPTKAELILRELFVPPSEEESKPRKKRLSFKTDTKQHPERKLSRKSLDYSYERKRLSTRNSSSSTFSRQSFSGNRRSSIIPTAINTLTLNPQLRSRRSAIDFSTEMSVMENEENHEEDISVI